MRRLQFFVFCLGILQPIAINDTLAVTVGIDLKKNQTLNLVYNQLFPDSIYGDGGYKNVNAFDLNFFFEGDGDWREMG